MKTVIVLGTARSGTSIVSGFLHFLGVDMNPANNSSVQNPKGSFEDVDFISLTTKMFLDLNKDIDIKLKYQSEIKKLVWERESRSFLWGWKSALTHFVFDYIVDFVHNPHLVFVFRDPLYNAKSNVFHKQVNYDKKITMEQSLIEVSRSNLQLAKTLNKWKNLPYILLSYEDCKKDPIQQAKDLASFLNIEFTSEVRGKVNEFIVPDYHCWKQY